MFSLKIIQPLSVKYSMYGGLIQGVLVLCFAVSVFSNVHVKSNLCCYMSRSGVIDDNDNMWHS